MADKPLTKESIVALLADQNPQDADRFASYCYRLLIEKRKDGTQQNPWMKSKSAESLAELFKRVNREGLIFDGIHVTLQSTGVSYDYIAYKNKMLIAYPESKIEQALVYEGDDFNVEKADGKVIYTHKIANPFAQKDDQLVGAYCVIKNKRGEFITLLSKDEIAKHRKVARTDYIWKEWFREMALKTVIKKACKQHFADTYEGIDAMDNENYDVENPLDLDLKWKGEIDAITTIDALVVYASANRGRGKSFDQYLAKKMKELQP